NDADHSVVLSLSLHDALPIYLGEQGSVTVQAMHAELNRSLEFAWYRTQVEKALAGLGYQIGAPGEEADYIALLDYGVEPAKADRSEEHTSELQSRENLVCRLL